MAVLKSHRSSLPSSLPGLVPWLGPVGRLVLLLLAWYGGAAGSAAGAAVPATLGISISAVYRLYDGDQIRIDVYDEPTLTTQVRIESHGPVAFPLVGDVGVLAGLTTAEASQRVVQRLSHGFLRKPVVSVSILDFGPRTAFVMGSVAKSGAVALNPLQPMGALQAIGQAGGFLDDANRAACSILRDADDHPGHKISLAVPTARSGQQDIPLLPGDIVIVPRLDRVYVIGQVTKPGAVDLPSQEVLTISKSISLAGGFDKYAKQNDVQLIRSGAPARSIDVQSILLGRGTATDYALEPGDTVFIPEGRF